MKMNMRVLNGVLLALALIVGLPAMGLAEEAGPNADKVSLESIKAHPTEGKDGVIELNNEICPVGGEQVSGKDSFIHEGVNYQICCSMCVGKFKKNLDKYAHSAAEVKALIAH
jgi:hypothetical protein